MEGRLPSGWSWGRHHKESEPPHFPGLHTCVKLSMALGAGSTALSRGWIWERLLLRLCKGPEREGKSWQRFQGHWFSKGDASTFQCFLGQENSWWGHLQSQEHSCGCPLETQGDLWTFRQEVEGPKPSTDKHRGHGGLRLLFSHIMNSLQVKTGMLEALKGFPFTGLGVAEAVEWLGQCPVLSSLPGELSCDVK